jgi:hypothetical protein
MMVLLCLSHAGILTKFYLSGGSCGKRPSSLSRFSGTLPLTDERLHLSASNTGLEGVLL